MIEKLVVLLNLHRRDGASFRSYLPQVCGGCRQFFRPVEFFFVEPGDRSKQVLKSYFQLYFFHIVYDRLIDLDNWE